MKAPARRALWWLLPAVAALALGGARPAAGAEPGPAPLSGEQRAQVAAALALHRAGDFAAAARHWEDLARTPTVIAEYVLYLRAESLAQAGQPGEARAAALSAAAAEPESPLAPLALLLAARESARDGDQAGAAALYRRFLDRHPDHPQHLAARLALGEALEASGQEAQAARVYRHLTVTAPASAWGDTATQRERVLAERGVTLPPLTARERAERAERLLAGVRPGPARLEAEAALGESPPLDIALRALRVMAEAWRRLGRFEEAARALERALGLAPAERRAPWLLERARLAQRAPAHALALLDKLVREHKDSPEAADALLLKGQILEGLGRLPEAEAAWERLAAEYSQDPDAGQALWRLGWLAWFRGDLEAAVARWGRVLAIRGGQAHREAAGYWLGRAHAERGQAQAAARQWRAVVAAAPRSYYGALAGERLGVAAVAEAERGVRPVVARDGQGRPVVLPAEPLAALKGEVRWVKALALRSVGLDDWADAELDDVARRAAGDPPRLFAVSTALGQDGRHHLALRLLRREFLPAARAGDPLLPRLFWEIFYPLGWAGDLREAARRAALDPLLVAAVVREESAFDPRARSRAGARGLMQLMPDTAQPMARARGWDLADGDLLDLPGPNLSLGTAYLSGLMREFPDPRLAVAAYNAGPRRVRQWWGSRRSGDLEVWVEEIPFTETRGFVKRVMHSWQEYRRVYASEP